MTLRIDLDPAAIFQRPSTVPSNHSAPEHALIFVSIAAYRDSQLEPTFRDCVSKARHPQRLRFGICWQHGDDEKPLPFAHHPHVRVLDVDWRQSRGACWARSEIMRLYQGEDYFLQIDSHCRFATAWDERMIATMAQTGSEKPVLSTYASGFTPAFEGSEERLGGQPQLMAIQTFTAEGLPQLKPVDMPERHCHTASHHTSRSQPMRARFLAAGFLFTLGSFVEEVGYDPELYFFGEEIAMTLRAFTHGYDLFHPNEVLVWHDYVRSYAKRHWDDHTEEKQPARDYSTLDIPSREKIKRLLSNQSVGSYGLGPVRTLADYEAFAGLSFRERKVQDYTRRLFEPPNPPPDPDWISKIYNWIVRILIDPHQLPAAAFAQPAFWYVTLHDEEGREIFRRDFPGSEFATVTGIEPKIALICEFESGILPISWTVWPVNTSSQWLSKIKGFLAEDDYAILREDEDTSVF